MGLTSGNLPSLGLHEASEKSGLLLVPRQLRKVGRKGGCALDSQPEDVVKARRLARLTRQVGRRGLRIFSIG